MNVVWGWILAVLAVAVGYASYGWPGVVLAITVIVFWMLLQFSRVMRVLRQAGQAPVGHVDNAVMLHSKLHPGMKLLEILPMTRSLGQKLADDPETFAWTDAGGDRVVLELVGGRLRSAALERAADCPSPGN
ncbi:MAG: hypothetical protein LW854_01470 [Rubrivivax sp.]|jgi:hypothetical protein|nr:hypothetical protein [Rubrivivax sp.]